MTPILQCVAPDGIVSQNVTLVRSGSLLGMRPKLQPIRPMLNRIGRLSRKTALLVFWSLGADAGAENLYK
jgi:hypothetical protein